jgi:hypothetical protein
VACPARYPQLFLWDAIHTPATSSWFNTIDLQEEISEAERRDIDLASHNQKRIFHVSAGIVKRHLRMNNLESLLSRNQFEYPKPFNAAALDVLFDVAEARSKARKMAVFKNARVTGNGVIMSDSNVCRAVRIGGANGTARDTMSFKSYQNESIPKSRRFASVITLANFAQGSWHFPMELLVALANVDPRIIARSMIHVKSLDSRLSWLEMVGITSGKVVAGVPGTVYADTVYAPQMAPYGKPFTSQLYWLKDMVLQKLNLTGIYSHDEFPRRRSIVLIQRDTNDGRILQNFSSLKYVLRNIANILGFDFHIHFKIGNFEKQFLRFVDAAVVVAPHGAGELFINFAPADLCLIELISIGEPLCFARMAYLKGQDYISVMRNLTYPRKADIAEVANAIRRCSLRNASLSSDTVLKVNQVLKSFGNASCSACFLK